MMLTVYALRVFVLAQRKEDLINEKWYGKKPPQRPKTSSAVARRMVSHALGVRVSSEQRRKDVKPVPGELHWQFLR